MVLPEPMAGRVRLEEPRHDEVGVAGRELPHEGALPPNAVQQCREDRAVVLGAAPEHELVDSRRGPERPACLEYCGRGYRGWRNDARRRLMRRPVRELHAARTV